MRKVTIIPTTNSLNMLVSEIYDNYLGITYGSLYKMGQTKIRQTIKHLILKKSTRKSTLASFFGTKDKYSVNITIKGSELEIKYDIPIICYFEKTNKKGTYILKYFTTKKPR